MMSGPGANGHFLTSLGLQYSDWKVLERISVRARKFYNLKKWHRTCNGTTIIRTTVTTATTITATTTTTTHTTLKVTNWVITIAPVQRFVLLAIFSASGACGLKTAHPTKVRHKKVKVGLAIICPHAKNQPNRLDGSGFITDRLFGHVGLKRLLLRRCDIKNGSVVLQSSAHMQKISQIGLTVQELEPTGASTVVNSSTSSATSASSTDTIPQLSVPCWCQQSQGSRQASILQSLKEGGPASGHSIQNKCKNIDIGSAVYKPHWYT